MSCQGRGKTEHPGDAAAPKEQSRVLKQLLLEQSWDVGEPGTISLGSGLEAEPVSFALSPQNAEVRA